MEGTQGQVCLRNPCWKRMIARPGGQQKLQVFPQTREIVHYHAFWVRFSFKVQLLSTLSWLALYQNYLCWTTFDIGASFLMSVNISKSQFEICCLTPFKLLPICKGTNWLVEHLDCSNIVDKSGQEQGTKGSKESSLGHLKDYLATIIDRVTYLGINCKHNFRMRRMIAVTKKLQILYSSVFCSYFTN